MYQNSFTDYKTNGWLKPGSLAEAAQKILLGESTIKEASEIKTTIDKVFTWYTGEKEWWEPKADLTEPMGLIIGGRYLDLGTASAEEQEKWRYIFQDKKDENILLITKDNPGNTYENSFHTKVDGKTVTVSFDSIGVMEKRESTELEEATLNITIDQFFTWYLGGDDEWYDDPQVTDNIEVHSDEFKDDMGYEHAYYRSKEWRALLKKNKAKKVKVSETKQGSEYLHKFKLGVWEFQIISPGYFGQTESTELEEDDFEDIDLDDPAFDDNNRGIEFDDIADRANHANSALMTLLGDAEKSADPDLKLAIQIAMDNLDDDRYQEELFDAIETRSSRK